MSKFNVHRPRILRQFSRGFSRRDFLRLGALAAAGPIFDVKTPRGLDFTLLNSPTPQKYLIETMPGGVALFDYNNDGLLDIFLVNGGRITSPMKSPENFDRSNPQYWNRLFRQNKDGSYTDVTEAAGLTKAGNGNYGMGVAIGDYDNDGYQDIFVTNYGKNILYHNNGDGTFTDVTEKAGVAGDGWHESAGFFDYDNDGRLDLFVTRYMEWDVNHSKAWAVPGRRTVLPRSFLPLRIFCTVIAAMARLKTSVKNREFPPKRAARWAFLSPTMTTTALWTFS